MTEEKRPYLFGDNYRAIPRKTYTEPVHEYKPIRALPPNTLTNADGTPYSVGYDSAIDEQKLKANLYVRAFIHECYDGLFSGYDHLIADWNQDQCDHFRHHLKEQLEKFALAILKETSSQ